MEIILRYSATQQTRTSLYLSTDHRSLITERMGWTTWWSSRGARTRSHPELGRENPQRPWYCVLRHGRVGRRQVFQPIPVTKKLAQQAARANNRPRNNAHASHNASTRLTKSNPHNAPITHTHTHTHTHKLAHQTASTQ